MLVYRQKNYILKATLNLISNYFLSLFPIPLEVLSRLEKVLGDSSVRNEREERDPLG